MADEPIGGGVAPGRRGTSVKRTEVRQVPMWVPWDNGGKGKWRLVPGDLAHQSQLIETTHDAAYDQPVKNSSPYYQGKGFVPEQFAQEHVPALIAMAEAAVARAASEMLPPPAWAKGVLGRYPQPKKVSAGASADAA